MRARSALRPRPLSVGATRDDNNNNSDDDDDDGDTGGGGGARTCALSTPASSRARAKKSTSTVAIARARGPRRSGRPRARAMRALYPRPASEVAPQRPTRSGAHRCRRCAATAPRDARSSSKRRSRWLRAQRAAPSTTIISGIGRTCVYLGGARRPRRGAERWWGRSRPASIRVGPCARACRTPLRRAALLAGVVRGGRE
eukprot:scaffold904_cov309-Prasinococcus_capsulatus_cf.AAC.1